MNRPCPICRKPRAAEFSPFCSTRCRDRDLARWLSDGYAVPGEAVSLEDLPTATGNDPED
ncbi:MAG: DNA gyrase inhibitor YacG [Alteraurantiacibacter sp.]